MKPRSVRARLRERLRGAVVGNGGIANAAEYLGISSLELMKAAGYVRPRLDAEQLGVVAARVFNEERRATA